MSHVRPWSTRVGLVASACLLLQCSAPQPLPLHSAFDGVPSTIRIDPQFRTGLDRLTTGRAWPLAAQNEDMDWLLLGVRANWGGTSASSAQERVWFVRVAEVVDPEEADGGRRLQDRRFEYTVPFGVGTIRPDAKFAVRCRRLRVETYDHNGEFMAAWSRLVPEIFPDISMFDALSTLTQRDSLDRTMELDASDDDRNRVSLGVRADTRMNTQTAIAHDPQSIRDSGLYEMVATLQALGMTPPLAPIREVVKDHIVQTPSLLTILLTGFKPIASASMKHATPDSFPWVLDRAEIPCYLAEFSTYLAGERCFDCRVIVAPSVPPVHLISGLLAMEAAHPRKPENRLIIRVLASSRTRPAWAGK